MKNQNFENAEIGEVRKIKTSKQTNKNKENLKVRLLICTKALSEYLYHKATVEMPRG